MTSRPVRLPILFSIFLVFAAAPMAARYGVTEDEEINDALQLEPDLENGERLFAICESCHANGARGTQDGAFPQLAGQHRSVIIKQIADIRFGNRGNPQMEPFAQSAVFGDPQGLADVAGYISRLPTHPSPGVGPGTNLERGEELYQEKCATCHEDDGMGVDELLFPRLQGQHYAYLLRELNWIREGKRRNVYRGMVNRLRHIPVADYEALADYISRMPEPTAKMPDTKSE